MTATALAFDPAVRRLRGSMVGEQHGVAGGRQPGPDDHPLRHHHPTTTGTVSGTLFLDTATDISPFGQAIPVGDQIAAIPYRYTAR